MLNIFKKITLISAVILLTGCTGGNVAENPKKEEGKKEVRINIPKKEITHFHESSEKKENKVNKEDKVKKGRLLPLEEIFKNSEEGDLYTLTGPEGFERVERLKIKELRGGQETHFVYEGVDYSKEDVSECYRRYYFKEGDLFVTTGDSVTRIIDSEASVNSQAWTQEFTTLNGIEVESCFRVTYWDSEKITIEIVPDGENENIPEGYLERHTLKKEEGLVSIELENSPDFQAEKVTIIRKRITEEEGKEFQRKRWNGISKDFIIGIENFKGYYDLHEAYFLTMIESFKEDMIGQALSTEEYEEKFKKYCNMIPRDSINGVYYLKDFIDTMYEVTEDEYMLLLGIEEYENRVKSINDFYKECEYRYPNVDKEIFSFRLFPRYYNSPSHNTWRAMEMYSEHFLQMNEGDEGMFTMSPKFIESIEREEYSRGVKWYLALKKELYKEEYERSFAYIRDSSVQSQLAFEKKILSGDMRYCKKSEELLGNIFASSQAEGAKGESYSKKIDEYTFDGDFRIYNSAVLDFKSRGKLLSSEELKNYREEYFRGTRAKKIFTEVEPFREEEESFKKEKIRVWTGNELVRALHNNRTIEVMCDIYLDDYIMLSSKNTAGKPYEGLIVEGLENITIEATGEKRVELKGMYQDTVLTFVDSSNIKIKNLNIVRVNKEEGRAVIIGENSSNMILENCSVNGRIQGFNVRSDEDKNIR